MRCSCSCLRICVYFSAQWISILMKLPCFLRLNRMFNVSIKRYERFQYSKGNVLVATNARYNWISKRLILFAYFSDYIFFFFKFNSKSFEIGFRTLVQRIYSVCLSFEMFFLGHFLEYFTFYLGRLICSNLIMRIAYSVKWRKHLLFSILHIFCAEFIAFLFAF